MTRGARRADRARARAVARQDVDRAHAARRRDAARCRQGAAAWRPHALPPPPASAGSRRLRLDTASRVLCWARAGRAAEAPPRAQAEPEARTDMGGRLAGLLERAPVVVAAAAAALAARVLRRGDAAPPPWPDALRLELPPAAHSQARPAGSGVPDVRRMQGAPAAGSAQQCSPAAPEVRRAVSSRCRRVEQRSRGVVARCAADPVAVRVCGDGRRRRRAALGGRGLLAQLSAGLAAAAERLGAAALRERRRGCAAGAARAPRLRRPPGAPAPGTPAAYSCQQLLLSTAMRPRAGWHAAMPGMKRELVFGSTARPACWCTQLSSVAGRQAAERLGVGLATSVCPVYPSALLVEISAGAAAAAAAAGAGAPTSGGPRGDQQPEWTVLSLRFTERCFSEGESPALLFHQRCDGTDCPQARRRRPPLHALPLRPRAERARAAGARGARASSAPPAAGGGTGVPGVLLCHGGAARQRRAPHLAPRCDGSWPWLAAVARVRRPRVAAGRHPLHTGRAFIGWGQAPQP